nr:hypothetical protein [uncultured Draconibacterium sp.]
MRRFKIFDIVALVSTIGIILWIISDFFGGMIVFLLSYGLVIIPIIITYLVSIIETIFSLITKGVKKNKIKLISHLIVILTIVIITVYNSDILKSKRVLTATLKDDLSLQTLIFRENGKCENNINGMFGFPEKFKGEYYMKNDTIIFSIKPYDNNFIPDTILLDRVQKAIFIEKDKLGNFRTEKEWLNHFKIE